MAWYGSFESILIVLLFFSSTIIFAYALRSLFFIFTILMFQENFSIVKEEREEGINSFFYIEKNINNNYNDFFPFISILIASYNENVVMERLLLSLSKLTYSYDRFETIIIDDSDDGTLDVLKKWQKTNPNLIVIHRQNRDGWKGGALNMGINNLNKNSNIVLIVDADNVLEEDTLEKIARNFKDLEKDFSTCVIQGYPKPIEMSIENKIPSSLTSSTISESNQYEVNKDKVNYNNKNNWISRGISFRLYQRNLIEFIAKEKLKLPLQITGSLFAVKTIILKSLRFSNDICEDWDLTLDIYLSNVRTNLLVSGENNFTDYKKNRNVNYNKINNCNDNTKNNRKIQNLITFIPMLGSYSEVTNNIIPYFRQRMRVSEGHTRGFRKKIIKILESKELSFISKIELLFVGLRYAKYISVIFLLVMDLFFLIDQGINNILTNDFLKILIAIQGLSLIIYLVYNFLSIKINYKTLTSGFTFKDVLYLFLVNIFTMPAFIMGSFLGLMRSEGRFYRTKRNK